MYKIIVICGPTATGKSDYAVSLAKKINGEIISADSRQVYKGLDIGSGKITKKEMQNVPHHMLDIASPKRIYTVAQYKKYGTLAIKKIISKGKIPIIVGGTGLYIDALIYDTSFPEVKPNKKLREQLSKKTLEELQNILKKLDKKRYSSIDNQNAVRLIRAIEIASHLGNVPEQKRKNIYDVKWIYLDYPDDVLKERINQRLEKRFKQGMIKEVEGLRKNGLSFKRLEALGLEYRYIALYLQNKLSKSEMVDQLEKAIWQYVKRQRTWFKKYAK